MLQAHGSNVIADFVMAVGNLVAKTFSVTKCNLNGIGFAPYFVKLERPLCLYPHRPKLPPRSPPVQLVANSQ